MLIRIDPSTGVPIWQQVVGQVTRQVMSGRVEPGERLPTVRELASELRINPNTVSRAYQELERDGIVETRRGQGSFARNGDSGRIAPEERKRIISERIDALVVEAAHLRVTPEELLDMVSERLSSMERSNESGEPPAEVEGEGDERI